jgi:hypothetical protein
VDDRLKLREVMKMAVLVYGRYLFFRQDGDRLVFGGLTGI